MYALLRSVGKKRGTEREGRVKRKEIERKTRWEGGRRARLHGHDHEGTGYNDSVTEQRAGLSVGRQVDGHKEWGICGVDKVFRYRGHGMVVVREGGVRK